MELMMPATLVWLDPRTLQHDTENVRRNTGDVEGLAETMQRYGVLQPLGVRREGRGYTVVYGNRRREAAVRAGLEQVPCVVIEEEGTGDTLVRQVLENVQRQQLNDLEQARAFRRLLDNVRAEQPGASEGRLFELVGRTVGLSQATVQRYLGLLDLARGVQEALGDGTLTVTQAQHLRAIKDPRRQEEVAAYAVREHLSAAQVSRICSIIVREPHLTMDAASDAASSGRALGQVPVDAPAAAPAPKLPPRPSVEEPGESDADLWGPEAVADGATDDRRGAARAGDTADGNKVFRIRSVASFCDEVDRIARCVQEGDLLSAAKGDGDAPMRLRLALKQLRFTTQAVEALAQQHGWIE